MEGRVTMVLFFFLLCVAADECHGNHASTSTHDDSTKNPELSKLSVYMNMVVREKLKIIPDHVVWKEPPPFEKLSPDAFGALLTDVKDEIKTLLKDGVPVTICTQGSCATLAANKGKE